MAAGGQACEERQGTRTTRSGVGAVLHRGDGAYVGVLLSHLHVEMPSVMVATIFLTGFGGGDPAADVTLEFHLSPHPPPEEEEDGGREFVAVRKTRHRRPRKPSPATPWCSPPKNGRQVGVQAGEGPGVVRFLLTATAKIISAEEEGEDSE